MRSNGACMGLLWLVVVAYSGHQLDFLSQLIIQLPNSHGLLPHPYFDDQVVVRTPISDDDLPNLNLRVITSW